MKKFALILFGMFAFLAFALIFTPVPIVCEDNAIVETGTVKSIYEGGEKDVVIVLDETSRRFYVNRGLENGLDLKTLQSQLMGHKVVLKYPNYWTPLDWNNTIKHLSKIEFEGEVIFNEFRTDC